MLRRVSPLLWAGLLALLVAACQVSPLQRGQAPPAAETSAETSASLYLEAVRGLIAQQQYFAALAHLQQDRNEHGDSPQLRLLEADCKRHLGETASARSLYQGLLDGPVAAQANHGLGLLLARSQPSAALDNLRRAVALAPVDIEMRNDLGYALLSTGQYREARTQLATALELAPSQTKARNNLAILLLVYGEDSSARQLLGNQGPIDETLLARLKVQAQSIKSGNQRANSPK